MIPMKVFLLISDIKFNNVFTIRIGYIEKVHRDLFVNE